MNIFVSHSKDIDYIHNLYKPLRESELNKRYTIFLPHEKEEVNTKNQIKESDIFLAEVSTPSTGEGIEIGWADMFKIPIICIYQKGSYISKSLNKITNNFLEYENTNDMIINLTKELKKYEI